MHENILPSVEQHEDILPSVDETIMPVADENIVRTGDEVSLVILCSKKNDSSSF